MDHTIRFITSNFDRYDVSSIDSYQAIGGFQALEQAAAMDSDTIIQIIAEAKIKGRGGAAYDMGRKWSQARAVSGSHKVIICNADEGEPGTFKDRTLIAQDPFNLIEAMIIAGYTIGAQDGYIYLREEYRHLRPILLHAIQQSEEHGFLGTDILHRGFSFHIHLYSGAGAYVCGEGTALIRSLEGKAGRPRMKPPFIKQSGLFALPTCVNNVESLSIIPHLLRDKLHRYLHYGTADSIGTKLISVSGNVNRPGVFEIPFGITIRQIIYDLAGGIQNHNAIRLIQFGGASGKVASPSILDVPYTYDALEKAGVSVGSGALLVVDVRTTVLEFLRMTQEFFSHESCGQCTPCREGNLHIRLILDKLATGTATGEDIQQMKKIADIMRISSLCGLGETAQSALLSAMQVFPQIFVVGGVQ